MSHTTFSSFLVLVTLLLCLGHAWAQQLSASPSVLKQSRDFVTLSWSGVVSPSESDVVALYSPADAPDWIGFVACNEATSWQDGHGTVHVPLVNMRTNYGFKLLRNLTTIVAQSAPVTFANLGEVLGVRLSPGPSHDSMTVTWNSGSDSAQFVRWGYSSDRLDHNATASMRSFSAADLCGSPANSTGYMKPGNVYEAHMTSLVPGAPHFYQVGSNAVGWSGVERFVAAHSPGPEHAVEVIVLADLGVDPPFHIRMEWQAASPETVHWVTQEVEVRKDDPNLVLLIGDVSYARGYHFLWDYFFSLIEPMTSKAPMLLTDGNHETDWPTQTFFPPWSGYGNDSGGECSVPYNTYFSMPQMPGAKRNYWYSSGFGPIHFVFASSEHDFLPGSPQYEWVKQDMASVDRKVTPWLIFCTHRPIYTSSAKMGDDPMSIHLRETWEPLLLANNVDLVLTGHMHKYERTCGIVGNYTCGERDEDGIVYLVIGNSGNVWQMAWEASFFGYPSEPVKGWESAQPDWSVYRSDNFGYSKLNVDAHTLTLSFYGDKRNAMHDQLVLQKP